MNNKLTGLGADHPANGPLTTERLGHVRDVLQRNLQYSNGGSMAYIIADAVKAIDELLEVRKAEPVAWTEKCEISNMQATGLYLRGFPDNSQGRDIALYTAPPAPVAVPPKQHWEELCRQHPDMSIGDAIIRAAWWNHCRAAMLQGGKS